MNSLGKSQQLAFWNFIYQVPAVSSRSSLNPNRNLQIGAASRCILHQPAVVVSDKTTRYCSISNSWSGARFSPLPQIRPASLPSFYYVRCGAIAEAVRQRRGDTPLRITHRSQSTVSFCHHHHRCHLPFFSLSLHHVC